MLQSCNLEMRTAFSGHSDHTKVARLQPDDRARPTFPIREHTAMLMTGLCEMNRRDAVFDMC